jgi:hypothetical protein
VAGIAVFGSLGREELQQAVSIETQVELTDVYRRKCIEVFDDTEDYRELVPDEIENSLMCVVFTAKNNSGSYATLWHDDDNWGLNGIYFPPPLFRTPEQKICDKSVSLSSGEIHEFGCFENEGVVTSRLCFNIELFDEGGYNIRDGGRVCSDVAFKP